MIIMISYLDPCRPYTEETLVELGASGVKNLVVVPESFVSEHIETLVRRRVGVGVRIVVRVILRWRVRVGVIMWWKLNVRGRERVRVRVGVEKKCL